MHAEKRGAGPCAHPPCAARVENTSLRPQVHRRWTWASRTSRRFRGSTQASSSGSGRAAQPENRHATSPRTLQAAPAVASTPTAPDPPWETVGPDFFLQSAFFTTCMCQLYSFCAGFADLARMRA